MTDFGGQVTQEMIDRAAVFTADGGDSRCEDGTPCTHTDCHYRCMLEKVLPLSPLSRRVEELEAALTRERGAHERTMLRLAEGPRPPSRTGRQA